MIYPSADAFVYACKEYLAKLDIGQLRAYGRYVGVPNPTEMNKEPLIETIVGVLVGKIKPVARSGRGAPVKNNRVDAEILKKVAELKAQHLSRVGENEGIYFDATNNDGKVVFVEDPKAKKLQDEFSRPVYRGQLETRKGVTYLLPPSGEETFDKIVVCVELIRQYELREGDVVTCYAKKQQGVFFATEILTVNEKLVIDGHGRRRFDDVPVVKPTKKLFSGALNSVTDKYFSWLLPIAKGQRGIVWSTPKTGKTRLLLEIAKTAVKQADVETFALLVEQAPETHTAFLQVLGADRTMFTSYADTAEKHVLGAEFLLKRAKRLAEQGKDVLVLVDSFSALMRAYNETEYSEGGKVLPCGMESKTMRYLKNYLGAARAFEKKGSLTIIGTVSSQTGDPADDALTAELKAVSNLQICLSRQLSVQRIFPAIDLFASQSDGYEEILSADERKIELFVRDNFTENNVARALLDALANSETVKEFRKALKI